MPTRLLFFIILHVLALAYFLETLRRVRQRAKEYPLEDTRVTMPFGMVRLRHVVTLYILIYLGWVLFSLWLYFFWMEGGSAFPEAQPAETILNL